MTGTKGSNGNEKGEQGMIGIKGTKGDQGPTGMKGTYMYILHIYACTGSKLVKVNVSRLQCIVGGCFL